MGGSKTIWGLGKFQLVTLSHKNKCKESEIKRNNKVNTTKPIQRYLFFILLTSLEENNKIRINIRKEVKNFYPRSYTALL